MVHVLKSCHLQAFVQPALCPVLHSPGHTQRHSPYPGKAHSLGASEHGVAVVAAVSPGGPGKSGS